MQSLPTRRPPPEWATPLALPLEFQLPAGDIARDGEARLANGQYTAVRLIKYTQKTTCDGCGRPRQAKLCAVIKDDDTGEELHIGMECLARMYRTQADAIKAHAKVVRSTLNRLLARLKLRDVVSLEAAVERVVDLARHYLPHAAPHLATLRAMDMLTPSKAEQDLLVRVRGLTLYHQEWTDHPDRARRRWTALRTHPMLSFMKSKERQRVKEACERALGSGRQLPDDEVHGLNNWLDKASRWTPPFRQLVAPEAYPDQTAYETALLDALQVRLGTGSFDRMYWQSPFIQYPTEVVAQDQKLAYAAVALSPKFATAFRNRILNEESYREGTRSVIVEWGPHGTFEVAAQFRQRGGFDRVDDDERSDVTRAGRTFEYQALGWALVEHYTPTHAAWHTWGRTALEAYL